MDSIPHRELRNDSARILARVAAGESFEITNNGEPVAVLAPLPHARLDLMLRAGRARPARSPHLPEIPLTVIEGRLQDELDDLKGER